MNKSYLMENPNEEIFVDIVYEEIYQVSNYWNVYSTPRSGGGWLMKLHYNINNGYSYVRLCNKLLNGNKKNVSYNVHRSRSYL